MSVNRTRGQGPVASERGTRSGHELLDLRGDLSRLRAGEEWVRVARELHERGTLDVRGQVPRRIDVGHGIVRPVQDQGGSTGWPSPVTW